MFEWDRNNLRKIAGAPHRAEKRTGAGQRSHSVYEQSVEGEVRSVYYGETDAGRLLAVILTERGERIRLVTAYDLDAGQKRDYLGRRLRREEHGKEGS